MTIFSRAEDIGLELHRRLSTIRTTNGAETDIGRDVMLGRRKMPGDDQPPCVVVLEGADDVQDQVGRAARVKVSQAYVIDGFDRCDPDNPNTKAHAMIRDIKKAIFSDGGNLGDKVVAVRYIGRDIGPRPDGVALVQARVMVEVEYAEDLALP